MTLSEWPEVDANRDMTGSVEDEIDLHPGTPLEIAVAVNVESGAKEDVDLTVGGPLASFASVKPDRLTVHPGEEQWATIRFDVPLNARLPAGPTAFTVDVSQHRNGNTPLDLTPPLTWSAEGLAFVMPVEKHKITLAPSRGRVRVDITNEGNISLVLDLEVRTLSGSPRAVLEETSIAVAPGATACTWLKVGGHGSYRVLSRSHDGSEAEAIGSSDTSSMPKPPKGPKPERDGFRESFRREPPPRRDDLFGPDDGGRARRKAPTSLIMAIIVLAGAGVAGLAVVGGRTDSSPSKLVSQLPGPAGSSTASSSGAAGAASTAVTEAPTTTTPVAPATRVQLIDDHNQPLPPPTPLAGPAPNVTIAPLHRLFSVSNSDYLYAAAPADVSAAKKSGFTDQGVLGYIVTSKAANTTAFYEMVSKDGRHVFLSDSNQHKQALSQGYTDVKTIGYVYTGPVGTGLPLMRASIGPLLSLTTVPVEQQRKLAAGWIDGGVVGFLLA